MSYKVGDVILGGEHYFGTAVWTEDLNRAVDCLDHGETAIVLAKPTKAYGWLKICTRRGQVGFVHSSAVNKFPR